MTEKKGFFRRVFSFGQPEEKEARPEPAAPAPEAHDEPQRAASSPGAVASVSAPGSDADALTETRVPAPSLLDDMSTGTTLAGAGMAGPSPVPAGPAATDEPEWLDPDAPEPEADFSWLEADAPETPAEAVADGHRPIDAHDERPEAADVPLVAKADDLPIAPAAMPAPAAPAATEEPDFSFLDPDAPLPDEAEEEADFSWLDPDAPLPDAPEDGTAVGAVPRTGGAAAPSTGEAGWRLREATTAAQPAPAARTTFIERLREGLARSSNQLSGSITALFTKRRLDEETLQDFEDVLLQADLGVETALRITDRLSEGRFGKEITGAEVRTILADEVEATLRPVALPLELDLDKKPHVILVVGVNGTGKTTTIGKLAAKLTRAGLKVTLCAGDTFRAAAVEQLKIWGERTGSEVIAKSIGADAAGLAFEAYDAAVENGSDVLIIDTAGRLQNKTELMAELEKIVRVLQKREPDAPHTVLQTLDATTGQNALSQVEIFRNVAGVNGLVMTKLDGTARGGILVAIAAKYRLPVYFVGVGEGIDDLEPFKARDFAMAIAGKTEG